MTRSKTFHLAIAALIGLALAASVQAQIVFTETFRSPSIPGPEGSTPCQDFGGPGTYPFPTGWLLRNVDARTPDASVAYVNDAWEVRDEFPSVLNNCVAFSTSFYSPNGAADDFMWTRAIDVPASGGVLAWRARAYDGNFADGYEVRVMLASAGPPGGSTGILGNQLSASTLLLNVAAEQTTWTSRTIRLDAYAGQTIHLGFRNNSNNKFLLAIDDVLVAKVGADLSAFGASLVSPYTQVPVTWGFALPLGVRASNDGDTPFTNVRGSAQLRRNGVDAGAPMLSNTLAALEIGGFAALTWPTPFAPVGSVGEWRVRYTLSATESELPSARLNNSLDSESIILSPTEFARHTGPTVGVIGIGQGNGGELGVQFTVPVSTRFVGVRFGLNSKPEMVDNGMGGTRPSTWPGKPLTANLRSFDVAANKPGAIIATTLAGSSSFPGGTYDLPFATGPQMLVPGIYVVTINEPLAANFPEDAALPLLLHSDRFQAQTTWVNWPTSPFGDWRSFEAFGPAFVRTPQISLLTGLELFKDGFEGTAQTAPQMTPSAPDVIQREPIQQLRFAQPIR